MTELPPQSCSYWLEISGDDDRLVAGDIVDLIHHHWHVKAAIAPPLELKVEVRDVFGAKLSHATTWTPMDRVKVMTGNTRFDSLDGVSAVAELGPVR